MSEEIIDGVEIVDLGLYIKKEKILVVSDFHLGYEEALNKQGIFIPRHQFTDTKKRLENIFSRLKTANYKLKTIIIAGDLRHEFGEVSRQELRDVKEIIDLMKKRSEKVILLKGNHETMHKYIKKIIKVKKYFITGNMTFLHGDEIPKNKNNLQKKIFIIGHAHPAIKLTDSVVSEKVKCFLKGKWGNKILIVLPSFNLLTEGTDVLSERLLSPFLQQNIKNFEVFTIPEQNKILYFGKVENLLFR